jgi:hypothetical protein
MTTDPHPDRRFLPWRSAAAGWGVAALVLLAGVPLFLCMPPWVDVTHYDMCVRTILRGGVYYREVFDTNLPGVAWAMAAVRAAFGWSYEALRAVDLVVMAAEFVLLAAWVRRAGGTGPSVAWLAAAVALWYPFQTEFSHVQRDGWMLLPALVAARSRLRRVANAGQDQSPPTAVGGLAVLEGVAWGLAVWVKPHVVIPAFLLWLASAVLVARREPLRRILLDLGSLVLGGLLAGAAGVAWLVHNGAWGEFRDIFLNWNPNYMTGVIDLAGTRFLDSFTVFRPWGLLYVAALPLAVLALWEGRAWSRRPGEPRKLWGSPRLYSPAETEPAANARLLLAVLFLGWYAQAVVFQKGLDYVQVPVMLLAMGVVASHRWAFGFVYLVWFGALGLVLNCTRLVPPELDPPPGAPLFRLEQYPLTDPRVMRLWPRCWREGSTPELRDLTGQYVHVHCCTNWEQLTGVANFLRTVQPPLGPRELNCWHDSTHPLYLMLDLAPATRYMHYGTAFGIPSEGDWIKKRIADEVRGSPQRYVVADLARMTWEPAEQYEPGVGDPLRLPRWFPVSQRDKFPWNQEMVFRSGRYVVYRVANPLGEIDIPDWYRLDELGPGEP